VLRLLLERPEEFPGKKLQQHIWPKDTFVDYDLAFKKAVNRIREVLGDPEAPTTS
jgi:DNA-binding winged helix-turn-helix (wHTH) protein